MKELIEALQIFSKYPSAATHCEHDTLCITGVRAEYVSPEDAERLGELSFSWSVEYDSFISFRFGSA